MDVILWNVHVAVAHEQQSIHWNGSDTMVVVVKDMVFAVVQVAVFLERDVVDCCRCTVCWSRWAAELWSAAKAASSEYAV